MQLWPELILWHILSLNPRIIVFMFHIVIFGCIQINIWGYSDRKLLKSIDTGHSTNIFCTKFVPETSDELVASGAGDAEV